MPASKMVFTKPSVSPMASALLDLRHNEALQCPNRDNIVVLITDGVESCEGNPVRAAKRLTTGRTPVELYVIGFNTSWAAENDLREVAAAGNTHTGPDNFYTADTVEELLQRLAAVTAQCTVQLNEFVDPLDLEVSLDGQDVELCTAAEHQLDRIAGGGSATQCDLELVSHPGGFRGRSVRQEQHRQQRRCMAVVNQSHAATI